MGFERVLILGGTGDAVALAGLLVEAGYDVVSSLAGVTADPVLPRGRVRRGGFGGADGLQRYVAEEGIAAVIDATHPFSAQISRHAAAVKVPLLRLERPAWPIEPGWTVVRTVAEAAAALPAGCRALVTIGRKEIAPFFARDDVSGVARMIEAVDAPAHWIVLADRPPFTLEDERALIERQAITHLVAKNSGGSSGLTKLIAAREKNLPVVMIDRPAKPEMPSFSSAGDVVPALRRMLSA